MKTLSLLPLKTILLLGLGLTWTATSHAQTIAYEGFDYAEGDLANQDGGSGWDGGWGSGGDWTVSSTGLNYTDSQGNSLITSGGSAVTETSGTNQAHFRELSSDAQDSLGSSSQFWMSFLIQSSSEDHDGTYGISLYDGGSEETLLGVHFQTGDGTRLSAGTGGADWDSGVSTHQDEGESETWLFVAHFDMVAESASYYLNPDIGGSSPTNSLESDTDIAFSTSSWDTTEIRLGQFGGSNDGQNFSLDEIRFGEDFASVTPIPEPSFYASLFGLAAFGGALLWRRHRR
ncbi:MAG: hypothetical protein JJT75_01120 [Opitutales bacterium]|nr:hypothetical protein [Opitutales bacterium]